MAFERLRVAGLTVPVASKGQTVGHLAASEPNVGETVE